MSPKGGVVLTSSQTSMPASEALTPKPDRTNGRKRVLCMYPTEICFLVTSFRHLSFIPLGRTLNVLFSKIFHYALFLCCVPSLGSILFKLMYKMLRWEKLISCA